MISNAMLNELRDDELRTTIEQAGTLLKERDEERKAKAMEQAKATLAAAGLSLKDLVGKGKSRNGKGAVYHSGRTYQHPANKSLTWNGKGKKPGWLAALEGEGKAPLEIGT
jgi:DNA-binding protein H-NS